MSLEGKSCIVTGAANGVGRAIAQRFAESGALVTLVDLDEERLGTAVAELEGRNLAVQGFSGDLTEKLTIANLISATIDAYDRLDILVNASRRIHLADPMDDDDGEMSRMIDQNVLANLALSRSFAQKIMKQNEGLDPEDRPDAAIVNVTSIATKRTIRNLGIYAVASAALDQLTRSLAVSLAEEGIRVNGLALGSVLSSWLRQTLNENGELRDRMVSATPMGRIGDSEEAANACLFLASPQASFVTGQILTVDGGRTLFDPVDLPAY